MNTYLVGKAEYGVTVSLSAVASFTASNVLSLKTLLNHALRSLNG